jgi:hypothetical protein
MTRAAQFAAGCAIGTACGYLAIKIIAAAVWAGQFQGGY